MRPAARSPKQPLGGTIGDLRHRLLRFHLPLALASTGVLLLFTTLPLFNPQAYPQVRMDGGVIPQQAEIVGHGGEQTRPMHDGRSQTRSNVHGEDQAGPEEHEVPQRHGGRHIGMVEDSRGQASRQNRSFTQRFTVATGYVATGLLALTLLIGPANLLLGRRNPVSTYLRRDVGTWTAIFSIVHVIFGLQVHGTGQLSGFLTYFVAPDGTPLTNSFGLANWTGLAATMIVVGLLAISSDLALRKLKAGTWKNLQRLNYALFALVIVHAFIYGALVRTNSPYTLLLLLSVIAVFVGQAVGVWLWRRRHSRTAAGLA